MQRAKESDDVFILIVLFGSRLSSRTARTVGEGVWGGVKNSTGVQSGGDGKNVNRWDSTIFVDILEWFACVRPFCKKLKGTFV